MKPLGPPRPLIAGTGKSHSALDMNSVASRTESTNELLVLAQNQGRRATAHALPGGATLDELLKRVADDEEAERRQKEENEAREKLHSDSLSGFPFLQEEDMNDDDAGNVVAADAPLSPSQQSVSRSDAGWGEEDVGEDVDKGTGEEDTAEDKEVTTKEDTPKEDTPKEDTPKEDTPKEDTPKEDTPKEDTPKEDTPKEDITKEDTPNDKPLPTPPTDEEPSNDEAPGQEEPTPSDSDTPSETVQTAETLSVPVRKPTEPKADTMDQLEKLTRQMTMAPLPVIDLQPVFSKYPHLERLLKSGSNPAESQVYGAPKKRAAEQSGRDSSMSTTAAADVPKQASYATLVEDVDFAALGRAFETAAGRSIHVPAKAPFVSTTQRLSPLQTRPRRDSSRRGAPGTPKRNSPKMGKGPGLMRSMSVKDLIVNDAATRGRSGSVVELIEEDARTRGRSTTLNSLIVKRSLPASEADGGDSEGRRGSVTSLSSRRGSLASSRRGSLTLNTPLVLALKKNTWKRTPDDINIVFKRINHFKSFAQLSEFLLLELCRVMTYHRYSAGSVVFRQGDEGSTWCIILSGSVRVSVQTDRAGNEIVGTLTEGDGFGELALLHNNPRAATVETVDATELLQVEKQDFQRILRLPHERELQSRISFLQSVAAFRHWPARFLAELSDLFSSRQFKANELIVGEEDEAANVYFVRSGKCLLVTRISEGGEQRTVILGKLVAGDHFGEIEALTRKATMSASVVAQTSVVCLVLSRFDFLRYVTDVDTLKAMRTQGEQRYPHASELLSIFKAQRKEIEWKRYKKQLVSGIVDDRSKRGALFA